MATQALTLGRSWDDTFHGFTDDLQLGRKYKKPARAPAATSLWSGSTVSSRTPNPYVGQGSKADVRARLQGIARRSTQVMVKITPGKNKTMRSVREHLQYIARDGEETLRDQDGQEIQGMEAVKNLSWSWQHAGPLLPEQSDHKLAFNLMFSMLEGTDERAVYAAVRATAEIEFAGHQWVMAQHFDQPQVHCHVCVKAESLDGVRLNPRKADLQRWRERFAHELRERNVEAEATRRASRLHQQRIDKPWQVTRLEERGLPTNPPPTAGAAIKIEKWKATERKAVSAYDHIIGALLRSQDAADRQLAQELTRSVPRPARDNTPRDALRSPPERDR